MFLENAVHIIAYCKIIKYQLVSKNEFKAKWFIIFLKKRLVMLSFLYSHWFLVSFLSEIKVHFIQ